MYILKKYYESRLSGSGSSSSSPSFPCLAQVASLGEQQNKTKLLMSVYTTADACKKEDDTIDRQTDRQTDNAKERFEI